MSDDVCFAPAAELAARFRRGDLSPVEAVTLVLERIASCEGQVNAFAHLDAERAIDQAKAAERALRDGEAPPLCGVPATIKDLFHMAGAPTGLGSTTQNATPVAEDAPVTARLKAAGAVLLGKTTTSEFGWTGVSRSPATGVTHNPWRHGYNAGASSAGAGAAAAAGFGALHQGSDGAGSIRMPAHFSGVFGFKPTWGTVPHVPVRNNDQISHVGPLTRTVLDAALFLNATAGEHPFDHTCRPGPAADFTAGLDVDVSGLRIGYSPDLGHARVDAEVAALVRAGAEAFESLGCHVEEVTPDWGAQGADLGRFFWSVHEAPLAQHLAASEAHMDPGLVACIRAGLGHSAEDYLQWRARKLAYVERMHRFLADWDLLLTPAVSVAAFPAERLQPEHWPQHPWDWLSWSEFCYPFNMSGVPAASVPCGFTADGLPVGLQLVGSRGADVDVLNACATFERARPWAQHRPTLTAPDTPAPDAAAP